jgi:hypothetical protein
MKKIIFLLAPVLMAILLLPACEKSSDISGPSPDAAGGTGTAGSLARFAIVGNYMYVVDDVDLNVFDITNPSLTAKVNTVRIGFSIETIYPYQGRLYIGSSNAMYIYSLTNPVLPQQLSLVQHLRSCDPVVVKDTTAYVTLRGGTNCGGTANLLIAYKVNNPTAPVEVKRLPMNGPFGLGYAGNGLYVCDGNDLTVFDISNPVNPTQVRVVNSTEALYDVIPMGNTLICYIDKGISFYNISNPLQPVFLSKIIN